MLFLLALAIAPVAVGLIYIYCRDLIAKEPAEALAKSFFSGATLPIIGVILLVLPLRMIIGDPETIEPTWLAAFDAAFIEAGIPEELFKFLVLYWLVWNSKDFDENFDGIVYAVFVSMGFACAENIMYVFQRGETVGYIRAFTAVPGHFFFAVIMGYYFSLAKFNSRDRTGNIAKAILLPMLAHSVYDYILFYCKFLNERYGEEANAIIGVAIIIFFFFIIKLWKQGFKRISELREMDKRKLQQAKAQDDDFGNLPGRKFSTYGRRDPRIDDLLDQ